jgi:hypothetical protein
MLTILKADIKTLQHFIYLGTIFKNVSKKTPQSPCSETDVSSILTNTGVFGLCFRIRPC